MRPRGLISPPKTRFSLTESDSHNNAAANPPAMPNYTSGIRRPTTVVNPKEQRISHRTPTSGSNANIRATKRSPPRIRASPKPAASAVPSRRRPTWAPNPNDLQNQKKLDHNNNNNSSSKTTAKITRSTPSSPRRNSNSNRVEQPRGISKNSPPNLKGAIISSCCGHGSGPQQDVKNNVEADCTTMIGDPHVNNQLQQLSIDGKDPANTVHHANFIYESVGSNTKEECSAQSNASRIFQIYKDIASHSQRNSSITSYFTKLKTLWDELETYSDLPQCCSYSATEKRSKLVEREKIMQFLVGLNHSYSTIGSQILLIRPFPTVEKAYSIIIQEEKQRKLVLSLEIVAETVMQNKLLCHNDQSRNGDDGIEQEVNSNIEEYKVDQNGSVTIMSASLYNHDHVEISSFPNESLLIDVGSLVRC